MRSRIFVLTKSLRFGGISRQGFREQAARSYDAAVETLKKKDLMLPLNWANECQESRTRIRDVL